MLYNTLHCNTLYFNTQYSNNYLLVRPNLLVNFSRCCSLRADACTKCLRIGGQKLVLAGCYNHIN